MQKIKQNTLFRYQTGYMVGFLLIGVLVVTVTLLSGTPRLFARDFFGIVAEGDPETAAEIDQLNKEIDQQKQKLDEISSKKNDIQAQLNVIQRETYSIQKQVSSIQFEMQDTEFDIEKNEIEIDQRKLEIERLASEIQIAKNDVDAGKKRLSAIIQVIDVQDRQSPLAVLFARDSFSSYLTDVRSAAEVQIAVQKELKKLKDAKSILDAKKSEQETIIAELEKTRESLERNKSTLSQQQEYQKKLLEDSRSKEQPFEELLSQLKREEEYANSQAVSLERAVREKLLSQNQGLISDENVPLAWPIIKSGLSGSACRAGFPTCSALFNDPEYYGYFRRAHYAIDIPMPQGSPVYAPADGYVTAVTGGVLNGTTTLSVLKIAHTDSEGIVTNMSTQYLHMSAVTVSYNPDNPQFVFKGDVIGYTGGKCGTTGAGICGVHTTGPHLHFEVQIGGVKVNPLNYLP